MPRFPGGQQQSLTGTGASGKTANAAETIDEGRANEQQQLWESAERTEPVKAWQAAPILMTAGF